MEQIDWKKRAETAEAKLAILRERMRSMAGDLADLLSQLDPIVGDLRAIRDELEG